MQIIVQENTLTWNGQTVRCAVGRGGVGVKRGEGDGITPRGTWPLRQVFYRPDRERAPVTGLPTQALTPQDGWCDDPAHPAYNRFVTLPFAASHEVLWRADGLYDLIVPMGYNDDPVVAGAGSAIFLHIARPDFSPTAGCVAVPVADLRRILADCTGGDTLAVIE